MDDVIQRKMVDFFLTSGELSPEAVAYWQNKKLVRKMRDARPAREKIIRILQDLGHSDQIIAEWIGEKFTCEKMVFNKKTTLTNLCGRANSCACNAQRLKAGAHSYLTDDEAKSRASKKRTATNLSRYGTSAPFHNPEIYAEILNRNSKLYGVTHSTQREDVKQRIRRNTRERHGVDHNRQIGLETSIDILSDANQMKKLLHDNSCSGLAQILHVDKKTILNYARFHKIEIKSSSYESEISAYLTKLNVEFRERDRKTIAPFELDFVIPHHKLAIEFNGMYWHSSENRAGCYHRDKLRRANEAGYRLLSINEDEWLRNSHPIKCRIENIIGASQRGVGARKLTIARLDNAEAYAFLDSYHIQGRTPAYYSLGAFHADTLVGVMCFSKQRGTQKIELSRFCSNGKVYAGMFSRMFNHFIKTNGVNEVISFADLRYSEGELYYRNGFICTGEIPPDYRYIKGNRSYHKSSFTKKKILSKFGLEGRTEKEMMAELKYRRLYDCGKLRFVWTRR